MAEPLSLNLQPASFRGVPFHVEGSSYEGGRRVQVHEYPQRDKPWAEDLGRATRAFTVDAFVVGPDYIDQANALIAAAEEEGSGTLVHPWFGSMEVSLKDSTSCRVRFDVALGRAIVSLSFVEAGELEFPSAADSSQAASQGAADELCAAATESFSIGFSVDGLPSFVSDAAGLDLSDALGAVGSLGGGISTISSWASTVKSIASGGVGGLLSGALSNVAGGIAGFLGTSLSSVLATPLALGQGIMDLLDLSDVVVGLVGTTAARGPTYAAASSTLPQATGNPIASLVKGIVEMAGNGGAGGPLNAPIADPGLTPARRQIVENAAAINALVRRGLLAQAVGMSSVMDATVQTDAHAVRDALCAALDVESLAADDVSYAALQAARRAVWTDISTRSSSSARLLSIVPSEVSPALVIAYDRYEDAERAVEIVDRNHIIHPGFVPTRLLQVLSR